MRSVLLLFWLLLPFKVWALSSLPFRPQALENDLKLILEEANLPKDSITFKLTPHGANSELLCQNDKFILFISSEEQEVTSAFYKGLREIGFLFPHPLRQISPKLSELKKFCGKTWQWKPTLTYRGFHLHTLHPNEWVSAFYQGHKDIGEALVRWLARNGQNIFDLSLLDVSLKEIKEQMEGPFLLAQSLQIHTGVSLGIALNQQNSFKLLNVFESYLDPTSNKKIQERLSKLLETLPLSYIVLEAGTSEFTPTDFEKTLGWLNLAGEITQKKKISLFTKVHVSSNQTSSKWGNYNFLPQFADKSVGVLPHTVMFYGVVDSLAPMYGNKNFFGIRDFMLEQNSKRPTWYYPETSYWVGMDMDIPLFLTDYLKTRAEDMKFLAKNKITGQLNFTSGQILGYWLFDWNLALLTDADYNFDPQIGLKLLGEDLSGWKKILDYQSKWYKEKGLISLISSANLQDELSSTHRIHERFTMKDLSQNEEQIKKEITLLKAAHQEIPSTIFIRDSELKDMIKMNFLRQGHALAIREKNFDQARSIRMKAQSLIDGMRPLKTNYPELKLFSEWKNPTAYQFGIAYPAATLYFWKREERQLEKSSFFPFWENIYDVWDIVF